MSHPDDSEHLCFCAHCECERDYSEAQNARLAAISAAEREVIRVAEASHTGGDGCALCKSVAALRRAREGKP